MNSHNARTSTLIRPRLTDFHGVSLAQAELDFAIPFFDEDLPLFLDPFLLWKSPSQQDNALHTTLMASFNHLNRLVQKGQEDEATKILVELSECEEVGLGVSATRRGKRLGQNAARSILDLFRQIPQYSRDGLGHLEEIQLFVDGVSKDRVSDIACNYLKSFLVDYSTQEAARVGIPVARVSLPTIYDYKSQRIKTDEPAELPIHPVTGKPLILVPKRWLRFSPWINFDDYFTHHCPKDTTIHGEGPVERVSVLTYNRNHYGVVDQYIKTKELSAGDCQNDPLFKQIPVLSARRKFDEISKLPTGKDENADKKYEDAATQLLSSLLYPHLDFADTQSRTINGTNIRDLIFYNNRSVDFLSDILKDYDSRQLVFELKNVKEVERDHVNQLNRYLANDFGRFGILVTRNRLKTAIMRNTVDLWSGQRRAIIALTDEDLALMVEAYDGGQRSPVDVLKKKYIEFRRACPS